MGRLVQALPPIIRTAQAASWRINSGPSSSNRGSVCPERSTSDRCVHRSIEGIVRRLLGPRSGRVGCFGSVLGRVQTVYNGPPIRISRPCVMVPAPAPWATAMPASICSAPWSLWARSASMGPPGTIIVARSNPRQTLTHIPHNPHIAFWTQARSPTTHATLVANWAGLRRPLIQEQIAMIWAVAGH